LPTQHTEYNVAHILFKWSSSRRTSIRDGCLMTKTLCISVLLSVLFLYVLPLPMLCFVCFPVLGLPHPLLIGHLISFMLSWFIIYSFPSNPPRLYTKGYRNCAKKYIKIYGIIYTVNIYIYICIYSISCKIQHCQTKKQIICLTCKKFKQKSFKIEDIWILVDSILVIPTVHVNFTKICVEE
jgi:hypothetical protein